MTKTINRTIIESVATVEFFDRKTRTQNTKTEVFNEKLEKEDIEKILYKRFEKGANEMPLFIHDVKYIEKKYSMDIDFFINNAKLLDVTE